MRRVAFSRWLGRALAVAWGLLALPALAAGWEQSFSQQALGSWLGEGQHAVLVAAAGERLAEAKVAARALEETLRASGRTRLVMGDTGLGALLTESDAEIVAKAAPLPVERVAVLRVFPGAPGAPFTAVVTLYDKRGKVLSAFSAVQGKAARVGSRPSRATVKRPVEEVAEVKAEVREEGGAQALYAERRISFNEGPYGYGGSSAESVRVAYQGKARVALRGPDFYTAVGRSDLADSYRQRSSARAGLLTGGLAAMAGGAGLMVAAALAPCARKDVVDNVCLQKRDQWLVVPGGVLLALGGGGLVWSWLMPTEPVDELGARRIADEYNQRLRTSLGLEEKASAPAPTVPHVQVSVGGMLAPGGGGVVLDVRM